MSAFDAALKALPLGRSFGVAHGKRYVAVKSVFNGGRSLKLVAEELGGTDYISLNYYDLASGPRIKPCEMPLAKVVDFVTRFVPDDRKGDTHV